MRLFKRKAKKDIFKTGEFNMNNIDLTDSHDFAVALLYASDMVDTIYPACAACYGISSEKNKTREEKINYIYRRVKAHHTSILEHSNVVLQVFIPLVDSDNNLYDEVLKYNPNIFGNFVGIQSTTQSIISMISEVRDVCRYLTIHTDTFTDRDNNPILRMTIGGSVRGYRYIFENIKNRSNKLFVSIFDTLKLVVPSACFADFIEDRMMENYTTIDPYDELSSYIPQECVNHFESNNLDVLNMDRLDLMAERLKLDKEDCFDFVSITVNFKNMSRVITQQVTRHRNGITQESQRYVNYSNAEFNSPAKYKEKYEEDKKYNTPIGEFTMQELGEKIASIYGSLVDQGVDKEDARGYLPQNIQCGKLFMTFTLRTLFNFLNLRLDSHAQAEINKYANELATQTRKYAEELGDSTMHYYATHYSKPIYKRFEDENIDIDEEV